MISHQIKNINKEVLYMYLLYPRRNSVVKSKITEVKTSLEELNNRFDLEEENNQQTLRLVNWNYLIWITKRE